MKVNVLTEIIRKVVREEVKKAIRSELKISTKKTKKEDIVSDTTSYAQLMKDEVQPTKPKTAKRTFTSNKALNDILNETVGGIPQDTPTQTQDIQTDYKNLMNKETFGTNDMASILSHGQQEPNVAEQTVGNSGARPTQELSSVLNKNYSSVLKAMDKKAKEKRGM